MFCNICAQQSQELWEEKILGKYNVKYYQCPNCDFIQTEEPFWLDEAYNSPINIEDTGILARNLMFSDVVSQIIATHFDCTKKYLDFAGGFGFFTRLMRDKGFDFYWYDLYTENLTARGFEGSLDESYEAVIFLEAFEHFANPLHEIEKTLKISKNLIFSTELFKGQAPNIMEWDYYGVSHGQHISFYSEKTLCFIAKKYNLNFYSYGGIHILTEKELDFSQPLKRPQLPSKTLSDMYEIIKRKNPDFVIPEINNSISEAQESSITVQKEVKFLKIPVLKIVKKNNKTNFYFFGVRILKISES